MIRAGVLGEETGPMDAHALHVGAPNQLASKTIFTVPAVDVRVDRNQLPRLKARDLGADLLDLADRLMPWSKRIDADEGPVVQVQGGATHAELMNLEPHVQRSNGRHQHVNDGKVAACYVTDVLHDSAIVMTRSARGMLSAMMTALFWSVVRAQVSACSWFIPCCWWR